MTPFEIAYIAIGLVLGFIIGGFIANSITVIADRSCGDFDYMFVEFICAPIVFLSILFVVTIGWLFIIGFLVAGLIIGLPLLNLHRKLFKGD